MSAPGNTEVPARQRASAAVACATAPAAGDSVAMLEMSARGSGCLR